MKIIPHKSLRNYNSSNIAKAITYTYKGINKRIRKEQKKIFFETNYKISYIIDIKANDVSFYFQVPLPFQSIIKEKIAEIWSKATIEVLDSIDDLSENPIAYQLAYRREDALSLQVQKNSNEPLNSILSVVDIMQDDDRVRIIYNFMPRSQRGWDKEYSETETKIKEFKPIDKNKLTPAFIFKSGALLLVAIIDSALEIISDFIGGNASEKNQTLAEIVATSLETNRTLSNSSKLKKNERVLNSQIVVVSSSKDDTRKENNAIAVCQSYRVLDEDQSLGNELIYKKIKELPNMNDYKFNKVDVNTVSTSECQNFIQIPARTLLEEHKIKHIDTTESEVPQELQSGVMCIGTNTYKGLKTKSYITTDKDFKNLVLTVIGPTRAGKTTLLANLSRDSILAKETTIIFDFCGNCDLSNEIASVIDKDKVLNIDCSDFNNLQGMGYNEVKPLTDNPFEIYNCAKIKASQLKTLVNNLNDDSDLKSRMERYLSSAALVVFINGGSIKDVFRVLQDHVFRKKCIDEIPKNQKENLEEYIITLQELDEWTRPTKDNPSEVIGTKISFVQGILNRVNKLKENTYIELMLKKDCSNNIDLVTEIEKSQLICIKMPETMFATEEEKDIYCTYWLTKIWASLQIRYDNIPNELDRVKVNIIFDELYQVPNCQELLRSKLSQIAKKTAKPIISCHYLQQIKCIRSELKAANSSYMLIAGVDKDNYNELKEELYPYELEDVLKMKRFHSLNLLRYEGGYAKFITALPPKINC